MKTLRLGSQGDRVTAWQFFLRGVEVFSGEASGVFDAATLAATQDFQRRHGLADDGIVGNRTFGVAMQLGFPAVEDDPTLPDSWDLPPKPAFSALSEAAKRAAFGEYRFAAVPEDADAIRILDGWEAQNIVLVTVPQLVGKLGAHHAGHARFHKKVAPRVLELFAAWEREGLTRLILSYAGSYVPRFVRGRPGVLSSHAFGSAFDINAAYNGLGKVPALRASKGSVRELVPIANDLGFYWGGHFERKDGMHFELARV